MTITTSPTSPEIDEETTVAASTLIGSVQVLELTSLPNESELSAGIVTLDTTLTITNTLQVAENDLATLAFTPDVAGEYGVTVHDINELANPPSTVNDRGGDRRFVYIGSESGTAHIGDAELDLSIVTILGDGATLRIKVRDDVITAASLVNHLNEKSRIAALQATVIAALAAMITNVVNATGGPLQATTNALRAAYEEHRVEAVDNVHRAGANLDDTTNVVRFTDADSQEGAIDLLNDLRDTIVAHLTEANAAPVAWHAEDDLKNLPLIGKANTLAEATVLSADLRERVYERHTQQIANPASHPAVDSINGLAVALFMDLAIVAYLDALAAADVAAPTGESEGVQDAANLYGFR